MKVFVCSSADELGAKASAQATKVVKECIEKNGTARILLSTGASQFTFFKHFVKEDIDWSKVEMFHLDEYVGMGIDHPASFQKYLRERFVDVVNPGKYHLIDGTKNAEDTIAELTALLNEKQVDLGLIGIGENAHIAFNDPPCDFDDERAYKVVNLSKTCIEQQLREGWFENEEKAFKQAISMTCKKIMDCKTIICAVPYAVKAQAIKDTIEQEKTNLVPATLLKEHADVTVYCDTDSAAAVDKNALAKYL